MGRFLLFFAVFALHLYVLLDVLRSPGPEVRVLPKWLWLVVSLIPVLGPAGWLLTGRPVVGPSSGGGGSAGGAGGVGGGPRPGRGPIAPDDDPEFLKRLDEQSWAARMERLRRERESGPAAPPAGEGGGAGQQAPPPGRAPDEAPGEGATR